MHWSRGAQVTTSASVSWASGDITFESGAWTHSGSSAFAVGNVGAFGSTSGGTLATAGSSSVTTFGLPLAPLYPLAPLAQAF